MKENDFKLLGSFLQESLKDFGIEKKLEETKVFQAWNALFGVSMEKYMNKVFVKNRTLFVEITSSVLKQNLLYQKDLLIEKINQHIGGDLLLDIHFI